MGVVSITPITVAIASLPPAAAKPLRRLSASVPNREAGRLAGFLLSKNSRNLSSTRLNAELTEIEPDLEEDEHDIWRTNGVSPDDFKYGDYDGHHTYFEEEHQGGFWEEVKKEYDAAEPPTGFQGIMSWLFLPAVVAGLAYHAPGEYLFIGAAIFVVVFCVIEVQKPDKPHNFEPEIYNMERGARDKLISDYNTMDIWDFNEKYGELWDFTIKRDKLPG